MIITHSYKNLLITETKNILNGNPNNGGVEGLEVTMDGQETGRVMTLLSESQREVQRPIRSLVTPKFTTVTTIGVNWNVCTMYATSAAVQVAKEMST